MLSKPFNGNDGWTRNINKQIKIYSQTNVDDELEALELYHTNTKAAILITKWVPIEMRAQELTLTGNARTSKSYIQCLKFCKRVVSVPREQTEEACKILEQYFGQPMGCWMETNGC